MPPTRVRGTINAVDEQSLSVVTREGPTVKIMLKPDVTVSSVKPVDLAMIEPGTFIGAAGEPGPNGELQALEVLVFPDSMRGTGEGHYGWDLTPNSSMTNATVTATVEGNEGRDLDLSYKGGTAKVRVPSNAPVVMLMPAARTDLKPGLGVFVIASKGEDGNFSATRINVGKYGVAPPM